MVHFLDHTPINRPDLRPQSGCLERKVASEQIPFSNDAKELWDIAREIGAKNVLAMVIQPEGLRPIDPCP